MLCGGWICGWSSAMTNGYNPMRWKCENDGCFNTLKRPKIEVFSSCFPGRQNFGDVDGLIERNGYFGLLEWKGKNPSGSYGMLSDGQRITYEKFSSRNGNIVFVVRGDAETMTVDECAIFWDKSMKPFKPADLKEVQRLMTWWNEWTGKQKATV
jgi:hypothetical protein